MGIITQTVLKKTPQKLIQFECYRGLNDFWLLIKKKTSYDASLWGFGFNYPKYNGILSLLSLREVLADRTNFDGFSNLWILKWITVNPILSCTLFWTIYEKLYAIELLTFLQTTSTLCFGWIGLLCDSKVHYH